MVLETIKAADYLEKDGITSEIIDIRSLKPLDDETIIASVKKTGRLLAADDGCHIFCAGSSSAFLYPSVYERDKAHPFTYIEGPNPLRSVKLMRCHAQQIDPELVDI